MGVNMFGKLFLSLTVNAFCILACYSQGVFFSNGLDAGTFYGGSVVYKAKSLKEGPLDFRGYKTDIVGLCGSQASPVNCGSPKEITNEMLSDPFLKFLKKYANIQVESIGGWNSGIGDPFNVKVRKLTPLMQVIIGRYAMSIKRDARGQFTSGFTNNLDEPPPGYGVQVWQGGGGIAECNPLRLIQLLLDNGADHNLKDERGWTALMWASFVGYRGAAQILLERGADPYVTASDGITVPALAKLKYNANGNHDAVIQSLKSLLIDKQLSPWIQAAETGDVVKATEILKAGTLEKVRDYFKDDYANISIVDLPVLNTTALFTAVKNNKDEMVKLLLDKGAKPNVILVSGDTLLIQAATAGSLNIVRLLVEAGVSVNHESNFRHTALTMASEKGHKDVVLFLLRNYLETQSSRKTLLLWSCGFCTK